MLLEKLTLVDVGLYRGRHVFDLVPRRKYGSTRPVILFGGLNGAGKTTILSSIRIVLYGRQSLGFGAAQKIYEEFIAQQIHKNPDSLVPANAMSIGLEFTYSQLGRLSRYEVLRSWEKTGKKLVESLRISRDGKVLDDLTGEQAQAFLNQLIPIGVSELFFFDGEKIADLASDTGEAALAASIRRLLGLDVFDKLRADLTIFARQKRSHQVGSAEGLKVSELLQKAESTKKEAEGALILVRDEVEPAISRIRQDLDRLEGYFRESGGAWAVSRSEISGRVEELTLQKRDLEDEVRALLAESYPISLAGKLCQDVLTQVSAEQQNNRIAAISDAVNNALAKVRRDLEKVLSAGERKAAAAVVDKVAAAVGKPYGSRKAIKVHALGDADALQVMRVVSNDVPGAIAKAGELATRVELLDAELSRLGEKIAQAPADGTLSQELAEVKSKSEELGQLNAKRMQLLEEARAKYWAAIDLTRKIKHLEERLSKEGEVGVAVERASSAVQLLDEFSKVLTSRKVDVLRRHFAEVFSRLARKDDLVVDAAIDETTFEVALMGKKGNRIPKQSLSAGEKQVYAIAMLEALAKTSGRSLPVIIDTPLGRLDGIHRRNLVQNYFPKASHQVIILSTDTEVDEKFYGQLSPHVSHAFHLVFDSDQGATRAEEGYFWKHQERELRDAS